MERHRLGETLVIPILLRDCLWDGLPFSDLQALPKDSRPVKSWQNRDAAWTDVVKDFILYDQKLLRVSTTVPVLGLQGRFAELYTDADMIRRGPQWFNGLKAVSTSWIASHR